MKKKFFCISVVVAIAVGAMINVNLSKTKNHLGDTILANVELLAYAEQTGCSASANCVHDGVTTGTVSCSGQVTCLSGINVVSCDGTVSRCVFKF